MMRFRWHGQVRFLQCLSLIGLSLSVCIGVNGQSTTAAAASSKPPSAGAPVALGASSEKYGDSIISPDDVLEFFVMDVAELPRQYRVSPSGNIDLPLLPNPLPAAGLTPSQLSEAIGKQLRDRGLVTNH